MKQFLSYELNLWHFSDFNLRTGVLSKKCNTALDTVPKCRPVLCIYKANC